MSPRCKNKQYFKNISYSMQHFGLNLHLLYKVTLKTDLNIVIDGCKSNNAQDQRKLFEMIAPKMLAICQRYVKSPDAAKDVLQEGFIVLFDKISTYKGDGPFEGWARKIFINTALMHIRKNDVLKYSDNIEDALALGVYDSNVLDEISASEIFKLVASMPDGFRTVFNLAVIEGYNHIEIAKMLSITESGSRSQLSRARMWLQERLKNNNY